jgi:hypothetical protein
MKILNLNIYVNNGKTIYQFMEWGAHMRIRAGPREVGNMELSHFKASSGVPDS